MLDTQRKSELPALRLSTTDEENANQMMPKCALKDSTTKNGKVSTENVQQTNL
jgi:hypothetical protein